MSEEEQIDFCLHQILRIASTLVPEKKWVNIWVEGYIVCFITEVKSWYALQEVGAKIEFYTFDLD